MKYPKKQVKNDKRYVFNRFIRDQRIIVIDDNNDNLGEMDTRDALSLAKEKSLDLVLISAGKNGSLSVCKILELGKFKYDQGKKEKILKKKQRENSIKIKEVKIRPGTDDNDLIVKANHLKDFFEDGNKIKISVIFRGRESAYKEIGVNRINKFKEIINAKYELEPTLNGRIISAILIPNKNNP